MYLPVNQKMHLSAAGVHFYISEHHPFDVFVHKKLVA